MSLIDKGQAALHQKCVALYESLSAPFLTTWSCITEAMCFLDRLRGWEAQDKLWDFVATGNLLLHTPNETEAQRMRVLMEKYQDSPMDLADASRVVLAEASGVNRIFTLDSDFYLYRIHDVASFEVIPLG